MRKNLSPLNRRQFLKACTGLAACGAGLALGNTGRGSRRSVIAAGKPNIVLIMSDALRADHCGAYGYGRGTTPQLDKWIANEGVTFRQASSAAAWTFPGTAAIMTGRLPFRLNATWDHTMLPTSCPTLAEMLRAAGYATAGFAAAPYSRAKHGFGRGFDHYDDSIAGLPLDANGLAGQVNTLARQWLSARQDSGPLFLFLYYFDAHTWYHPPAPYDTRYDPTYQGTLTPDVYKNGEPVMGGQITPSLRDVEHLLALYDGEIAYWDAQLGEMMTYLSTAGILDNAVVAVTSDHGDMFGEHGLWTHGNSVYEEVLRVPLLMRYSGVIPKGLGVDGPAQNMDVAPTLLGWAGASFTHQMDGVSLASAATGMGAAARDVFGEIDGVTDPKSWAYWLAPRETLHAVRRGEYKYIHHVNDDAADELYRLAPASTYEGENLALAEPGIAGELRAAVMHKFERHRVQLPTAMR